MIVLSGNALDGTVQGHKKVLLSPAPLTFQYSLHQFAQGFVISQNYKLVSFQLYFKNVEAVDHHEQFFLKSCVF